MREKTSPSRIRPTADDIPDVRTSEPEGLSYTETLGRSGVLRPLPALILGNRGKSSKMVLRRSIKALLVVVVAAVAIAIVSSFLARSRSLPTPPENDLLPEDVESRGTDFDHSEFKLGKIVFRVRSQTDTVNAEGERQLQQVELLVFDQDGKVQDAVTGKEATYWVEEKKIELRKDVEIRLADGTRVFSDRLHGDLDKEIIKIDQGFVFERSQAQGRGRQLTYRIGDRLLSIQQAFQMRIADPVNPLEVRSESLEYSLDQGRMNLIRSARVQGEAGLLQAQNMLVELTPKDRVRTVDARGSAQFDTAPHHFAGARVFIRFGESGAVAFQVESGVDTSGNRLRASYRQEGPEGSSELFSDRIDLVPMRGVTSASDLLLQSFLAQGDVHFDSPAHFLKDSRSDRAEGYFRENGRLERVQLAGDVQLHRSFPGEPEQHLQAPKVTCRFNQGRLAAAEAAGPLNLQLQGDSQVRTLQAQRSLEILFAQGKARQMTALGSVRLETAGKGLESSLEAPQLKAGLENGVLKVLEAGSGVRLRSSEGDRVRTSTSRQLQARFESGSLRRVRQNGDLRLLEEEGAARTELESSEASFDVTSQMLVTSGPEKGRLRQWDDRESLPVVTMAERFQISQGNRAVTALGAVASEFVDSQKKDPVRITADRMQAAEASDWILYDQGQPLVQTQNSRASGQQIRLQKNNGLLQVQGEVDSHFKQTSPEGEKDYHVQARELELDREAGHAQYDGSVQAQSEQMLLRAPHLELFLQAGSDGRVERVRAWDGVEIVEPTRTASGEICFYFPDENLVRLLGNPATVTDDKQGKASGPQLLFKPGSDTLIIESSPEKTP